MDHYKEVTKNNIYRNGFSSAVGWGVGTQRRNEQH